LINLPESPEVLAWQKVPPGTHAKVLSPEAAEFLVALMKQHLPESILRRYLIG
jgi:hypothetical protein